MKISPFKYGVTVSSEAFTNRENESVKLNNNLTHGINTCIISPRRWGKSSLVEKVISDIRAKDTSYKTCIIDLFSVSCEEEFLEVFSREVIKASSEKWEEWLASGKNFFKQLIPKLSVGVDPSNDFSIGFDWNEIKKYKDEILDLPEKIARDKGVRFIICLDEFQNLASFPAFEQLEKKMRAVWQRQKHVCYCLYGSKRHMMNDIFNNSSKPFYRFGDVMLLPKISKADWIEFLKDRFTKTGKSIDDNLAEQLVDAMNCHSWYVQQLAHYTWQKTAKKVNRETLESAFMELTQANSPLFQMEIENLSTTQVNLLKAIASGETKLTSAAVMNGFKLGTPRNVSKNRQILINADIIHQTGKEYELLDPAFENWFRHHFLDKPYF